MTPEIMYIARIALGIAFALFIPGYILVYIFFREFKFLERITFAVAFSIMIDVAIALFLGYNEAWAARTGGLTFENIIRMEIYLHIFLIALLIFTLILNKTKLFKNNKKINHKKNEKKGIQWY